MISSREVHYLSTKYRTSRPSLMECISETAEKMSCTKEEVIQILYERDANPDCVCYESNIGGRPTNEDAHLFTRIQVEILGGEVGVAGVFDGHAGPEVSYILSQEIAPFLESALSGIESSSPPTVSRAISEAIVAFDESLRTRDVYSGSTLTMALITKEYIYAANLGDSRTLIFDLNGTILLETEDHKPGSPSERLRIEEAGGKVINLFGIDRVNGNLSLSRAIGDFSQTDKPEGKPYPVSNVADVKYWKRVQPVWVFLACDGVWDILDSPTAVSIIRGSENACRSIVGTAILQGSTDNVTALLVKA